MNNRRTFFHQSAAAFFAAFLPFGLSRKAHAGNMDTREEWLRLMLRVARPVMSNLAKGTFNQNIPFEAKADGESRQVVASLEAFGRTFCGMAPWLNVAPEKLPKEEQALLAEWKDMTLNALLECISSGSPDRFQFVLPQCVVDAAFLVYGLQQCEQGLWNRLSSAQQQALVTLLQQSRKFTPYNNNWLLFSATIETFFKRHGYPHNQQTIDHALQKHAEWYKGDGWFGDGPELHLDYYNSFVIQPLLLENLSEAHPRRDAALQVAQRFAAQLERMIHPDGSFPPLGRSLAYRCGAFHHLAYMAMKGLLPESLPQGQARKALRVVIARTLQADANYGQGWLKIGLTGSQPGLGESYITTASLYLCLSAFLPLGLSPDHAFWQADEQALTQEKLFSGIDAEADKALKGMLFGG